MFACGQVRETGSWMDVFNPYTNERVGSTPRDGPAEVFEAIAATKPTRQLNPEHRKAILCGASNELRSRADEFALLITKESGLCIKDSRKEVERAANNLLVAAEESVRIHGEALQVPAGQASKLAVTLREPVGLICAITPFNRPLNQVAVKLGPALAAGNNVILKPSAKTPLTAIALAQLIIRNGLPASMLSIVNGDPQEIGPPLVGSPDVDMIAFTGSIETGEAVARAAGAKKLLLELGGNDPLIVLDDADMRRAASLAADGAFANAGQSCRGIKRIIVLERIADELISRLAEETTAKRWGDPFDPATDVGPLIDAAAASTVKDRCDQAVRDGAQLVCGGGCEGALVEPTVLDRVPPNTELVARETFGPVAPVIRAFDDDEAVALANSTVYGLQAGIVTTSIDRFMRMANALRVGGVNLMDGPSFDSPHIPFGGVKRSGVGREGVRYAIHEMTNLKTITIPQTW